tara:strand:- start:240 stop:488 length:249 start_codon:yes stop_codon:yes gene_type:complete
MKLLKDVKDIKFENNISEPVVMASSAGWYVGEVYNENGLLMPHSRLTAYMTKEEAVDYLEGDSLNIMNTEKNRIGNGLIGII